MIYEINHIWTAEMKWKWRNDRHSERNLCSCVKKPEKNSGFFTQLHKLRSLRRSFLHFQWNRTLQYTHDLQSYPNFEKKRNDKVIDWLRKRWQQARRRTTFELAVYMQFVFVTVISISTSETQEKLTEYQHHRKKNNRKILNPVDQPSC